MKSKSQEVFQTPNRINKTTATTKNTHPLLHHHKTAKKQRQ